MTRRFEITGEARRKLLCVAIRARCYRRRATLFFVWCGSVNYKTNAVTGNLSDVYKPQTVFGSKMNLKKLNAIF